MGTVKYSEHVELSKRARADLLRQCHCTHVCTDRAALAYNTAHARQVHCMVIITSFDKASK